MLGSSNEVLAAAAGADEVWGKVGGFESNSGEEDKGRVVDDGERILGGNRWPRLETLALLKIRSDMDSVFRDSNLKAPLWGDVSRKLGELGFNRSAKKCKEKFENVYKYHKRTKEGRSGKLDGKTYRFFDQLEALENNHHLHHPAHVIQPPKPQVPIPEASSMAAISNVPSVPTNPKINIASSQNAPTNPQIHPNVYANLLSSSTSSSTASDEEFEGLRRRKKRKWKDFFGRMTKEVMRKQEELQKKFLEAIEQREHERKIREESWRLQEIARINREHEVLVQERSTAAAKDAAVIAFLQKISDQQILPRPPVHNNPLAQPPLPPPLQLPKDVLKLENGENFVSAASPSRWPKAEVEALIKIRTNLDIKYQENGPKGPLWEEISAAMGKIGYNRSSKRCKEKWENINKYFKKVKESSKKRPEDSKTCPYFHQLNALYEEKKSKMAPLMVLPEQQWPPRPQPENQNLSLMEDIDHEKLNMEQNLEEGDSEEEEEIDDGGSYEIVTNKMSSMGTS